MKIDADEKELLESVERGEWKSAGGGKRERTRYSRYAKATFRKDRRLNIRLSSKDLEAIQKRALAEGLPYQTLIASLLAQVRGWAPQGDLKRAGAADTVNGQHQPRDTVGAPEGDCVLALPIGRLAGIVPVMRFEKIWIEQCRATQAIKRRFGAKDALDYLVGEKLRTFAEAARHDMAFARELPRFLAAIWRVFNEYELIGYVARQKPALRKELRTLLYLP